MTHTSSFHAETGTFKNTTRRFKAAKRRVNPAEQIWAYHKRRLQEAGQEPGAATISLRNRIVVQYEKLVCHVAHSYEGQCALEFEDLKQLGYIGLIKGLEKFDPTQCVEFSSFALPWIRGEILHHLRDSGSNVKVPRRYRETNSRMNSFERDYTAREGSSPTEAQIANGVGISVEKLREIRMAIANQMAHSIDHKPIEIEAPTEPEQYALTEAQNQRLEKAWSELRSNLMSDNVSKCELSLLTAVFCKRLNQRQLSKEFDQNFDYLKGKIQRVLSRIA